MTALRVGDNALSGRFPLSLANLSLVELQYADTAYVSRWGGRSRHG